LASGGAESGAVDAENGVFPADLQLLIDRWPGLAADLKKQIVDSAWTFK